MSYKALISTKYLRSELLSLLKKRIKYKSVQIIVDGILFTPKNGEPVVILCHSKWTHCPPIKFRRDQWEDVFVFLGKLEEQPIWIELNVHSDMVQLSQFVISI